MKIILVNENIWVCESARIDWSEDGYLILDDGTEIPIEEVTGFES